MRFGDQAYATRLRDTIKEIVDSRISKLRPPGRDGVVVSFDPGSFTASVRYLDEPTGDPVPVRLTSIQPSANGQIVRVEGGRNDRYVAAVYGNPAIVGALTGNVKYLTGIPFLGGGQFPTFTDIPPSWRGRSVEVSFMVINQSPEGIWHYSGTIEDPENPGEYITPADETFEWGDALARFSWYYVDATPEVLLPFDDGPPPISQIDFPIGGHPYPSMSWVVAGTIELTGEVLAVANVYDGEGGGMPFEAIDWPAPTYPDAEPSIGAGPVPYGFWRIALLDPA